MALVVEISLNGTLRIARYSIRCITNTDVLKPKGKISTYVIEKEVPKSIERPSGWKPIGFIDHCYDDPAERLVELAMHKING